MIYVTLIILYTLVINMNCQLTNVYFQDFSNRFLSELIDLEINPLSSYINNQIAYSVSKQFLELAKDEDSTFSYIFTLNNKKSCLLSFIWATRDACKSIHDCSAMITFNDYKEILIPKEVTKILYHYRNFIVDVGKPSNVLKIQGYTNAAITNSQNSSPGYGMIISDLAIFCK